MGNLIEHLESYLGAMNHGSATMPGLEGTGVQVVQYDSSSRGAKVVLSTLGLSLHPLKSSSSGQTIYQELLLFANDPEQPRNLPAVLAQIVALALRNKRPILKGDIIGPAGPLLVGSRMEAVFATLPIVLPPEFAVAEDAAGHGIALVWLLPITRREALWAKSNGWEAFEEQLDRQVPDALNWYRNELTLG